MDVDDPVPHQRGKSTENEKPKPDGQSPIKKLLCVSMICIVFMAAEIVGGIMASSLAILTDAAHMFSDLSGFMISIFSLWIALKPATNKMSYGYHRAEVIGAMCSVLLIWGLTIWLVYEAIWRVIEPEPVDGLIMLITAIFGLACNLVMAKMLHGSGYHHHHGQSHGHDMRSNSLLSHNYASHNVHTYSWENEERNISNTHGHGHGHGHSHGDEQNINVRAAFIHVIGDIIQSIGVIIAAVIIYI